MNTRIMTVVAIVGLLPSAAWALTGHLPNGPSYNTKTLVVTSHATGTDMVCGVENDLYNVVIHGPG